MREDRYHVVPRPHPRRCHWRDTRSTLLMQRCIGRPRSKGKHDMKAVITTLISQRKKCHLTAAVLLLAGAFGGWAVSLVMSARTGNGLLPFCYPGIGAQPIRTVT
jgi:hypothetical protein